MFSLKEKVWYFALFSRLFFVSAATVFNILIPDHSADAFVSPVPHYLKECFADRVVKFLFGGIVRWDAQYFWHISYYGYTFEHVLAFFPLYPLIIRAVSWPVNLLLFSSLNEYSLFVISALLINIVCFVKAAVLLYELSLCVLKSEKLAYKSAILFCVNPASIFFIAPYSETLFAFLTFYGLLRSGCGFSTEFSFHCGSAFGLAALTRSNGILNVGFIAYQYLKNTSSVIFPQLLEENRQLNVWSILSVPAVLLILIANAVTYIGCSLIIFLVFTLFQLYGYLKFCIHKVRSMPWPLILYARAHKYVLPGEIPEFVVTDNVHWCYRTLPLSYSYVQSYYWDVGFLKYYQFRQIPNFILALPVVWIILTGSLRFLKKHYKYVMFLGLRMDHNAAVTKKLHRGHLEGVIIPEGALPYVIHAVFLTIFCILCVNVQVTTRMIASSSPVLYWFASVLMEEETDGESAAEKEELVECHVETRKNMESRWKVFVITKLSCTKRAKCIQLYFLSYTVLGLMFFCNFYPWT